MPRKIQPAYTVDTIYQCWRNSKQLAGVRSQLTMALNACTNGAYVELDIKTARNLVEVCLQAEKTERGAGS